MYCRRMEFKASEPLAVVPDSPFVEDPSKAEQVQQPVYCHYKNRTYTPGQVICFQGPLGLHIYMCDQKGYWVDRGMPCSNPT